MEYKILRNNSIIPCIGLGTWKITDRDLVRSTIATAYEEGYRLIDTAAVYSNEIAIARAISENGLRREDFYISDKVWNTSRGYDEVQNACKRSLKKLKTDYLDMFLIHWPASKRFYPNWEEINAESWRGMEQLYKMGLVKNIGVCNFKVYHLEALKRVAKVMPFVNQIELHPGLRQETLVSYCKKEGIVIEASSPLGNGKILDNSVLKRIANEKKVSAAQICLRWLYQKDTIAIPKTTNHHRLRENISIFDFQLSNEELNQIDAIPYCGGIGIDSDEVGSVVIP